jgi:hypothetical protein
MLKRITSFVRRWSAGLFALAACLAPPCVNAALHEVAIAAGPSSLAPPNAVLSPAPLAENQVVIGSMCDVSLALPSDARLITNNGPNIGANGNLFYAAGTTAKTMASSGCKEVTPHQIV